MVIVLNFELALEQLHTLVRWSGPMPRFTFFGSRPRSRASRGQGMQDVDRPAEIQALPEPERARRPRVESEALGVVPRPEGLDRVSGQRDRRRDVGQEAAVRPPEPERAVGPSFDVIGL